MPSHYYKSYLINNDIWNYGLTQAGSNLISVDHDTLMQTLLPRTTGKFTRYGLQVNHLRYFHTKKNTVRKAKLFCVLKEEKNYALD